MATGSHAPHGRRQGPQQRGCGNYGRVSIRQSEVGRVAISLALKPATSTKPVMHVILSRSERKNRVLPTVTLSPSRTGSSPAHPSARTLKAPEPGTAQLSPAPSSCPTRQMFPQAPSTNTSRTRQGECAKIFVIPLQISWSYRRAPAFLSNLTIRLWFCALATPSAVRPAVLAGSTLSGI